MVVGSIFIHTQAIKRLLLWAMVQKGGKSIAGRIVWTISYIGYPPAHPQILMTVSCDVLLKDSPASIKRSVDIIFA